MDGRCVDPRNANNPRTTDAVDRGEVSQRILAYPSTHAERATEVPEFDDDGLVSGRDEAFRGFLEAGGTSRWEDQARGERNRSACDFGPRAITYRERGGLLNRADRGRRWKPWFAARGKVHACGLYLHSFAWGPAEKQVADLSIHAARSSRTDRGIWGRICS